MSNNPLILTVRFLLELAALFALGYWGWTQHEGLGRIILAIGLPVLAAVLWGTFRVPGYPGKATVAVPGPVRLLLEFTIFAAAVVLLAATGQRDAAIAYGAITVVHYVASYDYILALLRPGAGKA